MNLCTPPIKGSVRTVGGSFLGEVLKKRVDKILARSRVDKMSSEMRYNGLKFPNTGMGEPENRSIMGYLEDYAQASSSVLCRLRSLPLP